MIGERVNLAREMCGFTQEDLAEKAGITQSAVSQIEAGLVVNPSAENLEAIAFATGFDPAFFYYPEPLPDMPEGSHRRQSSLRVTASKQVRGWARWIMWFVNRAEARLGPRLPAVAIEPVVGITDLDDIEDIIPSVRDWLQVGRLEPIGNMIRAVERAGVVVARLPITLDGHDGDAFWPNCGMGGRPLIVLTSGHPGERDRFSVGHELGHLVLQHVRRRTEHKQAEAEANRFAGALLLPLEAARETLTSPVTLRTLRGAKITYRMSIQAAAQRALSLGIISKDHLTSIHKQMYSHGWRPVEPFPVPNEQPILLSQMIEAFVGSGSSVAERAEAIGAGPFRFNALMAAA